MPSLTCQLSGNTATINSRKNGRTGSFRESAGASARCRNTQTAAGSTRKSCSKRCLSFVWLSYPVVIADERMMHATTPHISAANGICRDHFCTKLLLVRRDDCGPRLPLSLIFLFHRALHSNNSIGYWRRWSRRASMGRRRGSRVWRRSDPRKTCAIEPRRRSLLNRDFVFDSESSAHCTPCEVRAT